MNQYLYDDDVLMAVFDEEQNECVKKTYEQTSFKDFKDQIINDITSLVNSSELIDGSDFIAMVLSSDEMEQKNNLKKVFQL